MLFAGIDWSDQNLDYCLLEEQQDPPLAQGQAPVSAEGLADLFVHWEQYARPDQILLAVETSCGCWVQSLLDRGYRVYVVHPAAIKKFREALYPQGNKTDKIDRYVIARFLKIMHAELKPLKPDGDDMIALRIATQNRLRLVEEQTAKINELKSLLKCHYPAFLTLFGSIKSHIALDFLWAFPTQNRMMALTPKRLGKWLIKHHYPSMGRFEKMAAILKAPALPIAPNLQEAHASLIGYLAKSLQALTREIDDYDRKINDLLDNMPEADWIRSLPGAGNVLAPALLACLGRDPERFDNPAQAQAFFGTAPVTKQSGKSCQVHFRFGCWKFARRTLQLFAASSCLFCQWAKEFYHKQRQKGKSYHAALRSLAHKWVKILLAMKKTGQPYDDNMFVNSQHRYLENQSQLIAVTG